ncbi:hypothetical protein EUGRSUZ_K00090 [Eucalyptus grandis]|uniref:Uncharacterized protein n=2 Tax=Eucalyptus grandis TaxID=71139 RepID=A0ACC3IPZ1_EUCGR|nr:hypothetical protein EUGRSUZ_K00090 [Eucalyptus grandis]
MAAILRGALKGIKEKGLGNFLRDLKEEGYLKCLADGNLLQTKLHNIGATLVGVDKFGNKYYERLGETQHGRHRWVEYAEKGRYNASQVPAEWHGWLHHITDHTGDEATFNAKTKEVWGGTQGESLGRGRSVYLSFQGTCAESRAEGLDQIQVLGTCQN